MAYTAGQKLRASDLNVPILHMYQTATQSLTNVLWTPITMNAEFRDSLGGHSTGVNPSRYTPNRAGYYQLFGQVAFDVNAAGDRGAQFRKNGTQIDQAAYGVYRAPSTPAFFGASTCSAIIQCNGTTDYIELWGIQNSGGALSTAYVSGFSCSYVIGSWLGSA
ncbi:MAG: hypothetical protein L0H64_17390 [Pseudonocardia sp.]|nr:hypothetical protein [Pseudonocardia sp.]